MRERTISQAQVDRFADRFNELAKVAYLSSKKGVSTDVVMQQWTANHELCRDMLKALGVPFVPATARRNQ